MPPRKSAASSGSTSRSKKSAGLAQPTLAFQSARPGSNGKKAIKSNLSKTELKSNTPSLSEVEVEPSPLSSPTREKDVKTVAGATSTTKSTDVNATKGEGGKRKQLDVKSKLWKGLIKDAKIQMGGLEPIHAGPDTHNDLHHVLRVFDMTSSYGPCVGVTRLQRWERAKKWGLNPPEEIREILITEQGQNDVRYRENVLYGWV
ncbi:uncharacterized protein I303_102566 [Kwoniella dejecticola CBS 10117]|uniref:DNA polymerase delta subunit 4 n=1 Tax=Kwoniella dejecticola CBS 10117 TaxID=1296121 RepID=A0A1A6A942_9TREE|nr:uncharacterized protein I303_02580 [Kwoniella dejecticola CBS 10117]OBR86572.1 hypothetical protein I303_02580 [Kwoniella dejecticola CBS 10117]